MREGARKWKGPRKIEESASTSTYLKTERQRHSRAKIAYLLGWDCNESSCVDMPGTLLQAAMCVSLLLIKDSSSPQTSRCRPGTFIRIYSQHRHNVRFARKNSPDMFRASHRTTTIFWPLSNCLATVLARRPRRCPLPSITT